MQECLSSQLLYQLVYCMMTMERRACKSCLSHQNGVVFMVIFSCWIEHEHDDSVLWANVAPMGALFVVKTHSLTLPSVLVKTPLTCFISLSLTVTYIIILTLTLQVSLLLSLPTIALAHIKRRQNRLTELELSGIL